MSEVLEPPTIRFLREDDKAIDEFGAHSRLAGAIAATLVQDPPYRVIGLLGPWGSGKSRVISLVKAQLDDQPVRFFEFDAWLHQSDAPRRAFLEVLLQWMATRGLGETERLKTSLDRILGKSERTESTVTPRVSHAVSFALALLLLVPLAAQFVRVDWMEFAELGQLYFWGYEVGLPFAIAVAVAATPFTILLTLSILRLFWSAMRRILRWVQKQPRPSERADPGSSVVALFANKVSEQRTDVKTRDPDPTALEFQRLMGEILLHIAAQTDDQIVFVVDNLDRLAPADALVLWGTIRGLFHGELATDRSPVVLPTVILPVDDSALELHKDDNLSTGFVEKTFDVAFRLPTPVLSQWQAYLRRRLEGAFGSDFHSRWADAAARILEEKGMDGRTPRSLNAFVNETATLWLQWREEPVSFAAIAYYVAHRSELARPWPALRDGPAWMSQFDPEWTSGVAAVRYGVEPTIAGQVLIEAPLQRAILDFDVEAFDELSLREGFRGVLRRQTDPYTTGNVGLPLSHTALLLHRLAAEFDSDVQGAWRNIRLGVIHMQSWRPRTSRDVEALEQIFLREPPTGRAPLVAAAIASISQLHEADARNSAGYVVRALDFVAKFAEEAGVPAPSVLMQGGDDTLLDLLSAAPTKEALRLIERPEKIAGAFDGLLRRIRSGPDVSQSASLVETFAMWAPDADWKPFVVSVTALMSELRIDDHFLTELEVLLLVRSKAPNARYAIEPYLKQERFRIALQNALAKGTPDLPYLLSLEIPNGQTSWEGNGRWGTLTAHPDLAPKVEILMSCYASDWGVLDFVDAGLANVKWRPLMVALVLARLARRPGDLSNADLAANLARLEDLTGGDGGVLWRMLAERPKAWAAIQKSADPIAARRAARGVLRLDAPWETRAPAAATLRDTLAKLPRQIWKEAILDDGEPMEDLDLLSPAGEGFTLSGGLEKGLVASIPDLLTSGDRTLIERWQSGARRLPRRNRARLYSTIAEGLITSARDPQTIVDVLGEALFDHLGRRSDAVVRQLLLPLLARRERLDWIVRHQVPLERAATGASREVRTILGEHIAAVPAESVNDSVAFVLARLVGAHVRPDSGPE